MSNRMEALTRLLLDSGDITPSAARSIEEVMAIERADFTLDRKAVRAKVGHAVTNVRNYPESVQQFLLGRDLDRLIKAVTDSLCDVEEDQT